MAADHEIKPFLRHSDETVDLDLIRPYKRRRLGGSFLSYAFVVLSTSLIWLLILFAMTSKLDATRNEGTSHANSASFNITSTRRQHTCGNSTEEALSMGCKYDASLGGWLPVACFDQAWVDDYLADGSNIAYADRNLTRRMTHEEVLERGFYWSSFRDHLNHCVAGWRRQSQAFFEDRPALDSTVINVAHATHCAQLLMDTAMGTQYRGPTENIIGYFECWVRD